MSFRKGIFSKSDWITKIEIDSDNRLLIYPAKTKYDMIYRLAKEVNWDNQGNYLYGPTPREWTHVDWYKHIRKVILEDCSCKLKIHPETEWINVTDDLRKKISRS